MTPRQWTIRKQVVAKGNTLATQMQTALCVSMSLNNENYNGTARENKLFETLDNITLKDFLQLYIRASHFISCFLEKLGLISKPIGSVKGPQPSSPSVPSCSFSDFSTCCLSGATVAELHRVNEKLTPSALASGEEEQFSHHCFYQQHWGWCHRTPSDLQMPLHLWLGRSSALGCSLSPPGFLCFTQNQSLRTFWVENLEKSYLDQEQRVVSFKICACT